MAKEFSLMQAHPWHGFSPGDHCPQEVLAYIEIVPLDQVKYEIHKPSGLMMIDRVQRYSSYCPTLYGFIPRTYCDDEIAAHAQKVTPDVEKGDGDPLDICVITEATVNRSSILVQAKPIGGFCLIDHGEADDKIIAVLSDDPVFGGLDSIDDLPAPYLERIKHYFLSYKTMPGEEAKTSISHVYDRDEAYEVINASRNDYRRCYSD